MKPVLRLGVLGVLMAGVGAVSAPSSGRSSLAGPPMLCQTFDIGDATSIPLDGGVAYARTKLVGETLAALGPGVAPIVRMETIRRAVNGGTSETRRELFASLTSRVLDAEASGKSNAEAWFDAGYYAATWHEMDADAGPDAGLASGCAGYAWLKKAISVAANPGEMEFGAALAVHPAMHKGTHEAYRAHLARAAASAPAGSAYERNVKNHCVNWSESFDDLKQKGLSPRDPGAAR